MNTAIIIHGLPSKEEYYLEQFSSGSNNHWLPWLQKQLLIKDILAQTPEMPKAYAPDYPAWKATLELFKPDSETILVAHSCGGGFLIRWLSEMDVKVGKVVLVAPWLDPENELGSDFFNFEISKGIVAKTAGLTVFSSDNDDSTIKTSIAKLTEQAEGVKVVEFHNYGHFCKRDLKTEAFPELLAEVLKITNA